MNHSRFFTLLKGMAMGMAEVVPGVSGGTIAFITNIYERLIRDIKVLTTFPVAVWNREGFSAFWRKIDGNFLLVLGFGMVLGILVGVLGITYLLEVYPSLVWGFFFGLIVASAIYIGLQIKKWSTAEFFALFIGIISAYYITVLSPSEGSDNLLFVFLSGMVAICALILPGISGSFILLLLGMYTIVLSNAKLLISDRDTSAAILLLVFILGCLVGISLFANFLTYLFTRYRYPTFAILTGFMIGSLNKIWPWRNQVLWLNKENGEQVSILPLDADMEQFRILKEINVSPDNFEGTPYPGMVLLCFVAGLILVWAISRSSTPSD